MLTQDVRRGRSWTRNRPSGGQYCARFCSITVKCLVKRALKRGGVESRYKGAHILRHSAATTMLRHGVSLPGVSTVPRHRSQTMTARYAKVDIALLSATAQPWPGRSPR